MSAERIQSVEISAPESPEASAVLRVLVVDKPRFSQLIGRMLAGRFETVCADDAPKALQTFQTFRPDAVVADLDVDGGGLRLAELLDMNLKERHTPFVLTCLKASADLVEQARCAGVDALLVKPFAPSSLIERLGNVLKTAPPAPEEEGELRDVAKQIRSRRRGIGGLPSLPNTHTKIRQIPPGSENRDLADQILMTPASLSAVLEMAGSMPDVFTHRVASLRHAMSQGGAHEVANLVLVRDVVRTLSAYQPSSSFDLLAFVKHSVGTGFIARTIARRLKIETDLSFMAGLMHDMGRVALDRFYPEFHSRVLEAVRQQHVHSTRVESQLLGVTHAQVGGYLAIAWNFPDPILEAIVCHHDPASARHHIRLASVIYVANAICTHLSCGSSGEELRPELDDPALHRTLVKLGVGPHTLDILVAHAQAQLGYADTFLAALMEGKQPG